MRLLLDTHVVSDFVRGEPFVRQALLACAPKDVAVSSVTVMEIAYGLARNPARARRIAPGAWLYHIRYTHRWCPGRGSCRRVVDREMRTAWRLMTMRSNRPT